MRERFGGGRTGRVIAALAVDTRVRSSTQVWEQGAVGEAKVGRHLNEFAGPNVVVLHDRRIPGSRANIDHLVVTPGGVWVVDTKRYVGKRPEPYSEGGLFGIGATIGLRVGGRKHDALVAGVLRQVDLVRGALGNEVPVRGALCFVDADWPLFGGDFSVRGVRVVWPKRLVRDLADRPSSNVDAAGVGRLLEAAFRAA